MNIEDYSEHAIAALKNIIDSGRPITSLEVIRGYDDEGTMVVNFGAPLRCKPQQPAPACKHGRALNSCRPGDFRYYLKALEGWTVGADANRSCEVRR